MKWKQRRIALILAVLAMTAFPLFQNCSPAQFESLPSGARQLSGGEGYGGKIYALDSETEKCPDPAVNPSKIQVLSATEAYLLSENCQAIKSPPKVDVTFAANPTYLYYSGKTYKDEAVLANPFSQQWIQNAFSSYPSMSGNYSVRTKVEAPAIVENSIGCCAKYSFDVEDNQAPSLREVAFRNISISNLQSVDAWGGGILMSNNHPGMSFFMSNVYIEPNWPAWVNFSTTNYDGLVTDDGMAALYAENLTIKNWNAHAAVDTKAQLNQFVGLKTEGSGRDALNFWRTGPHYLVNSSINNSTGSLVRFTKCEGATLFIYKSTFNGSPIIPPGELVCEDGAALNLQYLNTDPRTTGEMHPMFAP